MRISTVNKQSKAAGENSPAALCVLSIPYANHQTLTVADDSVGGNMAIVMGLMTDMRRGPSIYKQLLYYPVTSACFDTSSYRQFAMNYYLYREGMKWFWQQYTTNQAERNQITASPLRASLDHLRCLPQTMIIGGQADALRSEGEAFGEKLRCTGVAVTALRVQGINFVILNSLDQTMPAASLWMHPPIGSIAKMETYLNVEVVIPGSLSSSFIELVKDGCAMYNISAALLSEPVLEMAIT